MELIKILFHLSDSFSLDNFSSQRHRSMVALATLCPKLVVPYLTQEFYAPNYSLRHRMDILEVGYLVMTPYQLYKMGCFYFSDDPLPIMQGGLFLF